MLDLSLSQLLDLGGVGSQDRRLARRVGATPRSTRGPTLAEERTLRSNTADVLWFSLRDLWTRVFAGASAAIAARSAHVLRSLVVGWPRFGLDVEDARACTRGQRI